MNWEGSLHLDPGYCGIDEGGDYKFWFGLKVKNWLKGQLEVNQTGALNDEDVYMCLRHGRERKFQELNTNVLGLQDKENIYA